MKWQFRPMWDEKALKNINHKNENPTSPDIKLDLVIYYKSRKTDNLILKNSCFPTTTSPLQAVNVVYQHTCIFVIAIASTLGISASPLQHSRRKTAHLTDGAVRRHHITQHGLILKGKHMEDNTTILTTDNNIETQNGGGSANRYPEAINQHPATPI